VIDSMETSEILFLVTLYLIGFISFVLYSTDNNIEFYKNKKVKLESIKFSKLFIKYCFYSTIIISTLSILEIENRFFLLLWDHSISRLAGVAVSVVGVIVFILAKTSLGEHYTPCFNSFLPNQLVSHGIYKYIRHPIYLGNLLIFSGAFIASGSLWVGLNLMGIIWLYNRTATIEEKKLIEVFEDYKNYLESTGRFLPKIIPLRKTLKVE
jgi:protein-S-isoprenylcysteine O-methyltransferase Ste14